MNAKQTAQGVLNHLPDKATWDEILYEFVSGKKLKPACATRQKGNRLRTTR